MPGRRVELLPPTVLTAGASSLTFVSDVRFAVPTGRAKSGIVCVNLFGTSGGTGNVTAQVITAADLELDPNFGAAGATPAFWPFAHTSALTFAIATELGAKTAGLTTVLEWLRIVFTLPASNSSRVSAVAFLYDS